MEHCVSLWIPKCKHLFVEDEILLFGWRVTATINFADQGPSSQSYGFSSSHVWMWELDRKENWAKKNWYFLNCGVGEDSWESLGQQGDQTSQS